MACMTGKAQYIEYGPTIGFSTYQGDINPFSNRLSVQGANLLIGLNAGITVNEFYGFKFTYLNTTLSSSDKQSFDKWRLSRNLSFRTKIHEFSLTNEIQLFDILKMFRKYNLKPYLVFGVGVFKFNPKANYHGKWYDLQPLGTEGQGLEGSNTERYDLTEISFPLGFGLRYEFNNNFALAISFEQRITLTDYIDDVSTTYPDLNQLQKERGQLAALLSYRGGEVPEGNTDLGEISHFGRGNENENDWFFSTNISFLWRLDLDYVMSKKHKVNSKITCPYHY
jgi:hypothetical protein